jgi:hypothetical protein
MPGGVCAVLDYDTDLMAEYVAEMAMRVVMPNATVTNAFRKFVSQILTSTRLPSTTILLGMNYLAKRVNMLNAAGPFKAQEGQVWRMLTVALLLGSKFLDDNTFQNRSWSEVSGIAVHELNTMEFEWLRHIDWVLYVNLDRSHDYNAWLKSWKDWQENKKRQQLQQSQAAAARERLAPIITSIRHEPVRHHPLAYEGWTPEEIAEHERVKMNARYTHSAKPGGMYRSREGSWPGQYQNPWTQPQAPLTPPDSGYGTPEYLNSAASVNSRYNDWFNQAVSSGNYQRGYQAPSNHNAFAARNGHHFQPFHSHPYGHGAWDSNIADCNCHQCLAAMHPKSGGYFSHHVYGQAVMG